VKAMLARKALNILAQLVKIFFPDTLALSDYSLASY
jgi:hypothetical protein